VQGVPGLSSGNLTGEGGVVTGLLPHPVLGDTVLGFELKTTSGRHLSA
jgi:hypothetical protein